MERINLTRYRLNNLARYNLSDNVISTEAKIYYFYHKIKWENEIKALKFFRKDLSDEKVANIEFLDEHRKELEKIPSLVLPETLVSYYNKDRGIVMPFIDHMNLADLLKFENFEDSVKLKYLKAVGEVLNDISLVKKYNSGLKDFAINDLHEANVIIDSKTSQIRIVDIDSAYTGSIITASKYLTLNENLELSAFSNKYPVNDDESLIPNEQTDLYCYHMMILNFLYGGNVASLSQDEFYYYLDYLNKIGTKDEFIESCLRLYINQENINPKDYVEDLVGIVPRAGNKIYKLYTKKHN